MSKTPLVEPIVTRVAHTGADELRFRGKRVFGELLGNVSASQMLALGVGGQLLSADDAAVIDDIVTAMSSADPRLWPFKVTRLASAHGVAAYGVAATLIAGEGGMYGTNRLLDAARWLRALAREPALDDSRILAALQSEARGFGVVYRSHDERFAALMAHAARRGRLEKPHAALCMRAVRIAREHLQLEPHAFLAVAALGLDLGLDERAVAMIGLLLLFHDALANAIEGAEQAPRELRSLPVEVLDYRGKSPRESPRARERRSFER